MPHLRSVVVIAVVCVLSLSSATAAQIYVEEVRLSPQSSRDARPTEQLVPVGTSTISGTVVAAETGRPVPGARVLVRGQIPANERSAETPSWLNRNISTDANGQFSFPRLPAGHFTISVSHNQFLSTNYGQRRHNGQGSDIPLAAGQQLTLTIPLQRGGVIRGTVLGPDGEPQRNIQVQGLRFDMNGGFKRLVGSGYAQTDDRGVYRMLNLEPGEYVVAATPYDSGNITIDGLLPPSELAQLEIERAIASGPLRPPAAPGLTPTVAIPIESTNYRAYMAASTTFLPTYAPSSPVPSAATKVTVMGGDEKAGVDIVVRFTRTSIIQGKVLTPLDPTVKVQLRLVSDDPTIDGPQAMWTQPEHDERFYFRSVRPGKYTIVVQTVPGEPPVTYFNGERVGPQPEPIVLTDAQKMWARVPVVVAGEPAIDVNVSLQASKSVSGLVIFDMKHPPDLTTFRATVTLKPVPSPQDIHLGQPERATVGRDGRFTITGIAPGRYSFALEGRDLKSAVVGGRDTLDFPAEFDGERDITDAVLTVTESSGELSGTLTDASGKPAAGVAIIAAASDERFWQPRSRRIVVTRPGPDGCYSIWNLPAGAYVLAVVMDLEDGAQYDPDFLRSIRSIGVPVIIGDGAKVTQNLRVK